MNAPLARPSALPKMKQCRLYVGAPGSSPAAERGTKLDAIIRACWRGAPSAVASLNEEDNRAVGWALAALARLSKGFAVETHEKELGAVVPVEGVQPGTMDALCVSLAWLADFKTGYKRDYEAQMAAYALACMDTYFSPEWTAYLLFVDEELIVTHHFTREQAEDIVKGILNAPQVETRCEYCHWCGRAAECGLMQATLAEAVEQPALPAASPEAVSKGAFPAAFEALLADHSKAHDFLQKFSIVEKWVDALKTKLKETVSADDPYFQLVPMSGRRVVMPRQLGAYWRELGFERCLGMCSAIPLSKVQKAWDEVFSGKTVPEDIITTQGATVQLRLKKTKLPTT